MNKKEIEHILAKNLGKTSNKGFDYVAVILEKMLENEDTLLIDVYEEISKQRGTHVLGVERMVRYYKLCVKERMAELIDTYRYGNKYTNKEFIKDCIRLIEKEREGIIK